MKITNSQELASLFFVNVVSVDEVTGKKTIRGEKGQIFLEHGSFVWTRYDDPEQLTVAVTACRLLFRPYAEQREAFRELGRRLKDAAFQRRARLRRERAERVISSHA